MSEANETACPCGSGEPFDGCCGPLIEGTAIARTAEALMRSRYTAYTTQAIDYIVDTHHPDGRDEVDREGAAKWAADASWHGLQIVATDRGGPGDDEGTVEFIAQYEVDGAGYAHHERSTFARLDGRWYYEDGEMVKREPKRREAPKVGRNEPCPCGSGKKFKKCCGR